MQILRFYVPVPKDELYTIWAMQKELTRGEVKTDMGLAEDERVEDAGLDHEEGLDLRSARKPKARERVVA